MTDSTPAPPTSELAAFIEARTAPERRSARRFDDFVDKSGDCWMWTGPTDRKGYGRWSNLAAGESGLAHRLSLAREVPCPDPALFACHHCDTPGCVRPSHLYWGTVADNARDVMERGGVWNKGMHPEFCKRGHAITGDNLRLSGLDKKPRCRTCDNTRSREYMRRKRAEKPPVAPNLATGERHGMARLTWELVRTIRALNAEGRSGASLAREFGINKNHVWSILNNRAWKEEVTDVAD